MSYIWPFDIFLLCPAVTEDLGQSGNTSLSRQHQFETSHRRVLLRLGRPEICISLSPAGIAV